MPEGNNKPPKPFWPWLKSPSVESIREIQLLRLEQQSENDKRLLKRTKIKKEPPKLWFYYCNTPGVLIESPLFRTRKEAKEEILKLGLDTKIYKVGKHNLKLEIHNESTTTNEPT